MSVFGKFIAGVKTNPFRTLQRAANYVFWKFEELFETILFLLFVVLVFPLPNRTKARLKHIINPRVLLDYPKRRILLNADSEISIRRARACKKEPETVEWIEEFIQPNDVLYDIGANVGAYSLVASKFVKDCIKIYAFEPSFSTYNQLCQNILLNGCQDNIYPYMIALNDVSGMVEFEYHSLDAGDAEHRLINGEVTPLPTSKSIFRQRLLGYRLDDLVSEFGFLQPTHIKLDVDGAEFAVLRGASKTIRENALKSILVEVRREHNQAEEVENFLQSAGFKLTSMHDRGDAITWNYIFKKC